MTRTRHAEKKACPRCGVTRRVKASRKPLCRDCRDVCTPEEAEVWNGVRV